MNWRDELRVASIGGQEFQMIEMGGQAGQKVLDETAPETDNLPPIVYMGRLRPTYRIRGFLTGSNYLDQRDALLAILNEGKKQEFIHPWRGRLIVAVSDVSWTHASAGGAVQVDFTALEWGGEPGPLAFFLPLVDAGEALEESAASVKQISTQGIESSPIPVPPVPRLILQAEAQIAKAHLGVNILSNTLNQLVNSFYDALSLVHEPKRLIDYIRSQLPSTVEFVDVYSNSVPVHYPHARFPLAWGARIRLAQLAVEREYVYAEQAESTLEDLNDLWEAVEEVDDLGLFELLQRARTACADTLSDAIDRLPREASRNIPQPTPLIVVAYDAFGDDYRNGLEGHEEDISYLNGPRIKNHAYVKGDIRILSR